MLIIRTVVFAARPGGGSPCPAVLDSDLLSDARMQQMAKERGTETVFVLPPTEPGAAIRLRYFAPRREMEMCVHATVAAVTVLAGDGCARAGTIAVQTPLGVLNVEYGGGAVTVPQLRPVFAARNPSRETTAAAMGIMAGQIAERPIVSVSCSRPKLIIPLGSPKTLRALRPDTAQIEHLCQTYETTGFYPYAVEMPGRACTRHFPYDAGYPEDPATGVAAAALAAYLACHELRAGTHTYRVHQGWAVDRPSLIIASAQRHADGRVDGVAIRGSATISRS